MLSYDEALERIHEIPGGGATERVPLQLAGGRVTAAPVKLDRDQPGFDRSTMDGYAVALDGDRARFRVIGVIHAGEDKDLAPKPGEAVRIMTGAPCPPDVTVVPIELTDGGEAEVEVTEAAALTPRKNIAFQGEDGHDGDVVIAAGQRLDPVMLAAVAMAGQTEVEVWRRPRIGIVTTGDEVGGAGRAGIRDSNGPLLVSLLESLGCEPERWHARDEPGALKQTLEEAGNGADVVLTTGGVSMGTRDLVPDTVQALGFETLFHKVAMQPGKPVLVARNPDGRLFVGLPGNPVSVLATGHLILAPVLGRLLGGHAPRWMELALACDHQHRGGRRLFLPARLENGGVTPVKWNGSGDLLAAASADGLVDLAPRSELAAGQKIRFMAYAGARLGEFAVLPPRTPRG